MPFLIDILLHGDSPCIWREIYTFFIMKICERTDGGFSEILCMLGNGMHFFEQRNESYLFLRQRIFLMAMLSRHKTISTMRYAGHGDLCSEHGLRVYDYDPRLTTIIEQMWRLSIIL